LRVQSPGDDVEAVVDDGASSAALSKDLSVLDPGDDVLDAGADAPVGWPSSVSTLRNW
jgi:hypothetical protein